MADEKKDEYFKYNPNENIELKPKKLNSEFYQSIIFSSNSESITQCSMPFLEAITKANKRRQVFRIENLIIHLADQRQAAESRSQRLGRGITKEMKQLTERLLNAQEDYKGMTGKYFYPVKA